MSIAALIEAVEAGTAKGQFATLCGNAGIGEHAIDAASANIGDLNAAAGLHVAMVPGVKWVLFQCDDGSFGCNIGDLDTAFSNDPARAWLLAILRAKEAGQ